MAMKSKPSAPKTLTDPEIRQKYRIQFSVPESAPKRTTSCLDYFREAIAYYLSAEKLYEWVNADPPRQLPLRDPIYYLYHQTLELSLKSCVYSYSPSVGFEPLTNHQGKHIANHDLSEYFHICQRKKLLDVNPETDDLISLFGGKKRAEDYRYAGQIEIVAQLQWVRVVVGRLLENIEPHIIAWADSKGVVLFAPPGPPTRLRFAIGRPPYSTIPVRLKLAAYPPGSPSPPR
jgi:hypothetical protein